MKRVLSILSIAALGVLAGCDKSGEETTAPDPGLALDIAAQGPEPEPEPTHFTVGTWNLNWFFDAKDDRSKIANEKNAANDEDWKWKMESVAKILIERDVDVVALQSVGGEREMWDLVTYIRDNGGPDYDFAFIKGTDRMTRQNVAVLSRFGIYDKRTLDEGVSKHVITDIELPNGEYLSFVNVHLRAGKYKNQKKTRAKEAVAIRKEMDRIWTEGPVMLIGDIGAVAIPEDENYATSAAGRFAGKHTKKNEDDDRVDSADWYEARSTNAKEQARDRMFFCGVTAESVEAVDHDKIIRGEVDPAKTPWSQVAVDERDVSDHVLVVAKVSLEFPKPPTEEEGTDAEGGEE